jgi:hypothetical protein
VSFQDCSLLCFALLRSSPLRALTAIGGKSEYLGEEASDLTLQVVLSHWFFEAAPNAIGNSSGIACRVRLAASFGFAKAAVSMD